MEQGQFELILARIANDSLLLSTLSPPTALGQKERERIYRLKFACFNCPSVRPSVIRLGWEDDEMMMTMAERGGRTQNEPLCDADEPD